MELNEKNSARSFLSIVNIFLTTTNYCPLLYYFNLVYVKKRIVNITTDID